LAIGKPTLALAAIPKAQTEEKFFQKEAPWGVHLCKKENRKLLFMNALGVARVKEYGAGKG